MPHYWVIAPVESKPPELPDASGKITTTLIIGLAMIESLAI